MKKKICISDLSEVYTKIVWIENQASLNSLHVASFKVKRSDPAHFHQLHQWGQFSINILFLNPPPPPTSLYLKRWLIMLKALCIRLFVVKTRRVVSSEMGKRL